MAANPQPTMSLEQQHCKSPSKADPTAHTAHRVTVSTSLALCLSFPHCSSRLLSLMLKVLLNMQSFA